MIPDGDGEAFSKHSPNDSVTAASIELFSFLADVIHYGLAKLGRLANHDSISSSLVGILWLRTKQLQQLFLDSFIDVSTRLCFR